MRGEVLGFDRDSNAGAISGHDGQRYDFVRREWRGAGEPSRGESVDFVATGWRATEIYPVAAGQFAASGDAGNANLVYILYLVGLVVGVTGIVGLVIAYVNRAEAPEWLRTHYQFQIRTFWIGLLYGLIGVVTFILVIGVFWLFVVFIWWIVRCVKGMQHLQRGQAYPNPVTWWW